MIQAVLSLGGLYLYDCNFQQQACEQSLGVSRRYMEKKVKYTFKQQEQNLPHKVWVVDQDIHQTAEKLFMVYKAYSIFLSKRSLKLSVKQPKDCPTKEGGTRS